MRVFITFCILSACLVGIISIFWHQEIKYTLPTPIPQHLKSVPILSKVELKEIDQKGPLFIHFFNPDCPCSRFNASHVIQLIRNHGDSIHFIIVVPSLQDLAVAKRKFGESLTYAIDPQNKIAVTCGVYSTPQAVLITKDKALYFRGNYNRSRYCTSQASNYAELALVSFLNRQPSPAFGLEASLAYGCELADQTNTISEIF
jgi:hypothetical protein